MLFEKIVCFCSHVIHVISDIKSSGLGLINATSTTSMVAFVCALFYTALLVCFVLSGSFGKLNNKNVYVWQSINHTSRMAGCMGGCAGRGHGRGEGAR